MRTRRAREDFLGSRFLLLLGLRLLTTAFLLAPWAGFDEVYHQGYVEVDAERLRWPAFRQIALPRELVAAAGIPPDTNYETQQSPLYYAAAGLLLRLVPRRSPVIDLYVLRLANAVLAFAIGWILWRAAFVLRVGWPPVALLALVPGFAIATCRVCNDVLCGFLISIAVLGGLRSSRRTATFGAAAAGLAPWAKLYGLAVLPGALIREATRRNSPTGARLVRIALIVAPTAVLGLCSWLLLGHPAPIMYNVRGAPAAKVFEVPWVRDVWTVFKSHVWISGMSFHVFPNGFYIAVLCGMLVLFVRTLRSISRENAVAIGILAAPLLTFGLALVYQDWRAFSFYGGGGATGGWYVWAVAVPEMLLLAYGSSRGRAATRLLVAVLSLLLLLTVLGDCALVLDSAGALATTGKGHIVGIASGTISRAFTAYLSSRSAALAAGALVLAVSSWILAGGWILRAARAGDAGAA